LQVMFSNNNQNFGMNEDNDFFVQKNDLAYYRQDKSPILFENDPFPFKNDEKLVLPNIFENDSTIRLRDDLFEFDVNSNQCQEVCFVCKSTSCNCLKGTEEEHFAEPRFNLSINPIIKERQEITQFSITNVKEDTTKTEMKETEEDKDKEVIIIEDTPVKEVSKSKSKYDSNLFLVRRACFRGFSEYFKNKFSSSNYSWQRKRGNKKKKTPLLDLIRDFANTEFGGFVEQMSEEQWLDFRKSLLTILFSHRYKKSDDFLEGIDFTQIRNVLYHYTTESRNEFLKNPHFCFLIHHFSKSKNDFLEMKIKEKSKLNHGLLKMELNILDEEAMMALSKLRF